MLNLMSITRESVEKYSFTNYIHCNGLYFDIWNSIKNKKNIFGELL
jgi:hypothetical protein